MPYCDVMLRQTFLFFILFLYQALYAFDVIIPCTEKDMETLQLSIRGIKRYGVGVERVFVVSKHDLTGDGSWFDEDRYPFTKRDVYLELIKGTLSDEIWEEKKESAWEHRNEALWRRTGWYYQQLLKLYAPFVFEDLSSQYLVLDSDTIFLRKTEFIDEAGRILFNPGKENHVWYFVHGKKLLPGWGRVYPAHSGISHHMVFDREILQEMFDYAENTHHKPFWKAFLNLVSKKERGRSGASEYELFFNYCLMNHPEKCVIRKLKWANVKEISAIRAYRKMGYDYVSCHAYLRGST